MNYFTATVPDTLSSWCYCKHISWFHRHLDKGSAVSLHNFCYGNKYVLRNHSSSKLHRYHNRNQSGRLLDKLWEYWIRIRIPANLIPKHDDYGIQGNLKNAQKRYRNTPKIIIVNILMIIFAKALWCIQRILTWWRWFVGQDGLRALVHDVCQLKS